MAFAVNILSDIGSPRNQRRVTVTDVSQSITLSPDNRAIELYNESAVNEIRYGDSSTTFANGFPIAPGEKKTFNGTMNGWQIHVICDAAKTASLAIVEYPK